MGNCFTCYKVPTTVETPDPASTNKDKEEIMENRNSFTKVTDFHRHSLSSIEHQSNGNTKPLTANMASEHLGSLHRDKSLRTFYSRIQPLTRTTSNTCPNNNEIKPKEIPETKLQTLFDQYKDNEEYILEEGVEKLLADLNLSPEEFKVLILAWKLNAENMCQFSRHEFITGLQCMHADSIKSISNRLVEIVNEVLNNPELFKDLYRFTFKFGLDKFAGQRILPADVAVCLWKVVFSMRVPSILEQWFQFLELNSHIRGISGDTWSMFLNLINIDLASYDDSEAWPSIFDDFVEFINDNTKDKEACV